MRVRLNTLTTPTSRPRVDRSGNGRILGASIISEGPALGHDFEVDQTTVRQVAELAGPGASIPGPAGRWTHGNLCADGLGTHLGRWQNVQLDRDAKGALRAVGDFAFSASAHKVQPAGLTVSAPTYLMDLAEQDPDSFGVSAVLELDDHEEHAGDDKGPVRFARVAKVLRADFVGDPAANASGLFSGTPSALAEQATAALAEAESIHGSERVRDFLRTYLGTPGRTGRTPNPETSAMDIETLKKAHAAELAERDTKIKALEAAFDAAQKALAAQREREIESRIASLQERALPNAIKAEDIQSVRDLYRAGNDALAARLGDLFVQSAKSTSTGGDVVPLGRSAPARADAAKAASADLFAAAGERA